jgi:hypothetical protein
LGILREQKERGNRGKEGGGRDQLVMRSGSIDVACYYWIAKRHHEPEIFENLHTYKPFSI